jgi:hypothetical protein
MDASFVKSQLGGGSNRTERGYKGAPLHALQEAPHHCHQNYFNEGFVATTHSQSRFSSPHWGERHCMRWGEHNKIWTWSTSLQPLNFILNALDGTLNYLRFSYAENIFGGQCWCGRPASKLWSFAFSPGRNYFFLMGNCLRYKFTTNSFHAFQKDAVSSPGAWC